MKDNEEIKSLEGGGTRPYFFFSFGVPIKNTILYFGSPLKLQNCILAIVQ
jgi:hypothetical protein